MLFVVCFVSFVVRRLLVVGECTVSFARCWLVVINCLLLVVFALRV